MKAIRLLFFSLLCLMALGMNAQRIAVVGFKAGAYVSLSDIDGISETFQNNFNPQGYTLVDRLFVDKTLAEQRIQRSEITEDLAVYAGKIMNVSKIVVGKVYKSFDGGYQVEVTVLDVQSEQRMAGDGAEVQPGKYRETITALAKRLAGKIAITSGATVPATPSQQPQARTEPYVIYGYLKVFPNDLGTFDAEPKTVISRLNQSQQYGYGTWRLPTNEELALMRANNIVGYGDYMTKEHNKGIVRLVTDKEKGEVLPAVPAGYVDLGLPSGTLWKDKNESGFYDYDAAVRSFGSKLPTKEQLEELKNSCQWTWTGSGYKVVGPSGASIVLPAAGLRNCDGDVGLVGGGYYGSSTPIDSDDAWNLYFDSSEVSMDYGNRCDGLSVRLVQD